MTLTTYPSNPQQQVRPPASPYNAVNGGDIVIEDLIVN